MSKEEQEVIRVIVRVTKEGHPELYADMSKVPSKYRPERMRSYCLNSLIGAVRVPPVDVFPADKVILNDENTKVDDEEAEKNELLNQRRLELKNDLRRSFDE